MRLRNRVITCVAVVSLSLAASVSRADYMTYVGTGLGANGTIHAAGTLGNNDTTFVGQLKVNYHGQDILAYCVDLNHYAGSGNVSEVSIASLNRGEQIAWLWDTYASQVSTGVQAAGLQVAIWEAEYETQSVLNVSTGYFTFTNNADVIADANLLLASMPANYQPSQFPTMLDSVTKQDLMVPEPLSLSVLAAGAMGLLWKRRRVRPAGL